MALISGNESFFNGYACFLKFQNVEKPLIVNNGINDICIKDNDYEWIEVYPDNGKYALTIMLDDKGNLIEWYFDIAQKIGLEDNVPYEDDLYLDMIITPDGKQIVIDEDELLGAEKSGDITSEDVNNAYKTLNYLKEKFVDNFENLKEFTEEIKGKFSKEK